jgi:hypothetical protein
MSRWILSMADVEPIRRAKKGSATLLSLLSKDEDEKEGGGGAYFEIR